MKNKTRGAYPSMETALDRDLDTVSDAVLEVELEEVKVRKKLPRAISTNGADKTSSHFSPNGAEKESEHDSGQQRYRFGNQTIDISKISYENNVYLSIHSIAPAIWKDLLLLQPMWASTIYLMFLQLCQICFSA